MDPWNLHEMYPALDVKDIPGYLNHWDTNSMINVPKFDGHPSSTICHVTKFIKYASEVNMVHENACMRLFINSLGIDQRE